MRVAGSLTAAERDVAEAAGPRFAVARDGGALVLRLGGDWLLARGSPDAGRARQELRAAAQGASTLRFDAEALGRWDTVLPSFLVAVVRAARAAGLEAELGGLPDGAVRLVRLATAVP
ncbi:MAG TPA: hypothetical protein VFY87_18335, partial [Geminicoccaceae bacterium]|nr:hypothetical protein [Geminicoccaceae bacterium]